MAWDLDLEAFLHVPPGRNQDSKTLRHAGGSLFDVGTYWGCSIIELEEVSVEKESLAPLLRLQPCDPARHREGD